jgi:hypothetical protein
LGLRAALRRQIFCALTHLLIHSPNRLPLPNRISGRKKSPVRPMHKENGPAVSHRAI